jgi:uncharacterized protein (TIGR03000 family)
MGTTKPTHAVTGLLMLIAVFSTSGTAAAQLMSKWGHPVFTIGETPYDSINVGHGTYPGGPGFIPGYGYYPGVVGPSHYPWMDGPGTPFDRRKLDIALPGLGAAVEELPLAPVTALVIVKIPAEAELWIDGVKTTQGGSYRQFTTPPLPAGRPLAYTLRAVWRINGAELTRVEEVHVQPGTTATADFLTTDSWTGKRLISPPTLPND